MCIGMQHMLAVEFPLVRQTVLSFPNTVSPSLFVLVGIMLVGKLCGVLLLSVLAPFTRCGSKGESEGFPAKCGLVMKQGERDTIGVEVSVVRALC